MEVGDDRIDQRAQIDIGLHLAGPSHPREREDVLQRLVHLGDGIGHAQPILLVLDRLDADTQGSKRGAQVVADRAQHPVLLVQHRPDPEAQRIERGDQAGHVERPLFGDRFPPFARVEALGRPGQVTQRAGDTASDPQHRQQDDAIEDQRLRDQPPDDEQSVMRPTRPGHEPTHFGRLDRDQQFVDRMAVAVEPATRPVEFGGVEGADARHDLQDRMAQLLHPLAHHGFDCGHAGKTGLDRVGRDAPHPPAIRPGAAPHGASLDRVVQPGDGGPRYLFEDQRAPLTEQQRETDRLREEQGDGDQQRHLGREPTRP